MRNYLLLGCVLVLSIWSEGLAQEKSRPGKENVLAGYERSLSLIWGKVAFHMEVHSQYEGFKGAGLAPTSSHIIADVRRDGNRMDEVLVTSQFLEGDAPNKPRIHQETRAVVTDQAKFYHAPPGKDPDRVMISRNVDKFRRLMFGETGLGVVLDGIVPGNTDILLPEMLRQADSFTVREETETIDGHETYVLEAKTRYGTHILWIDPAYGFNPRRILVRKTGQDLWDNLLLSKQSTNSEEGDTSIQPSSEITKDEMIADTITIDKVGDAFVVTEARITNVRSFANGESTIARTSVKRSQMNFDPDFNAMKAFEINVPNGTSVEFMDERRDSGVRYQWRNGKVIPIVDASTVAEVDKTVEQLKIEGTPSGVVGKSEPSFARGAPRAVTQQAAPDSRESLGQTSASSHSRFLHWILAALLLLGIGVWVAVRALRRGDDAKA